MRADSDEIYMEQLQHKTKEQSRHRDAEDFDEVWDDIAAGIAEMRRWDPGVVLDAPYGDTD